MRKLLTARKTAALSAVAVAVSLLAAPAAYANPPFRSGVITGAVAGPAVFHPGDRVRLSWHFHRRGNDDVRTIEVWFAHSTGMGHAPQVLVRKRVDPAARHVDLVVPPLSASEPGNIWWADLVWRDGDNPTELALIPVTVE
jgi:hypothetical protein